MADFVAALIGVLTLNFQLSMLLHPRLRMRHGTDRRPPSRHILETALYIMVQLMHCGATHS